MYHSTYLRDNYNTFNKKNKQPLLIPPCYLFYLSKLSIRSKETDLRSVDDAGRDEELHAVVALDQVSVIFCKKN